MANNENASDHNHDANRDPITNAPGAHPVGTGLGAASVGTAATVVGGALGGPVGAAVGAAVGAVAGGLIGKGVAEKVDPTIEDNYWRDNYHKEPYARPDRSYEHYAPAYRLGHEGYVRHSAQSRRFEDAEPHMRAEYERNTQAGMINWEDARLAAHAAWRRVDQIHGSGSGMGAGPTAG